MIKEVTIIINSQVFLETITLHHVVIALSFLWNEHLIPQGFMYLMAIIFFFCTTILQTTIRFHLHSFLKRILFMNTSSKKITLKSTLSLLSKTYTHWMSKEPFQLSAAVSYYALFSFPALLIIVIQTAGIFYKKSSVKGKIMNEIGNVLGSDAADSVESMIRNVIDQEQTGIAIIIGIATLLYGATGMFIALQKSLNVIWGVIPKPKNEWIKMIKDRVFSLGLILVIGFLLLTSLILTAVLAALTTYIELYLPDILVRVFQWLNFIISLGLITVLFAMIFRYLPDVEISWKTVWLGAFVTSILFAIGKSALGFYFGSTNPGSAFGAAGSVILILLWVSYSSLILFFGASFTQVYAAAYGEGISPAPYAEKIIGD